MLSDFILLEEYYGPPEATRLYEDLAEEYGLKAIESALKAGHISLHLASCKTRYNNAPSKAKIYLTEQGRFMALNKNT